METVIKEIGLSWKGRNKSFILGGIMIFGSFFLAVMFKKLPLMPLTFGFVILIIGFFNSNVKIFKFYSKHFVFQPGIAHKKMILNEKLESFDIQKRTIIIYYKDAGKNKKVKFLKEVLTDEDVEVLRNRLNEIIVNRVGV